MSSVVVLVVVVVVVVAVLPFIICLIYSFALRAAPRRLESPLGLGQALEVAADLHGMRCQLCLQSICRDFWRHTGRTEMRRGCFTRCKQMPRVYLVRVRMCNVPVAVASAVAVTVAANAGDRAGCVELR